MQQPSVSAFAPWDQIRRVLALQLGITLVAALGFGGAMGWNAGASALVGGWIGFSGGLVYAFVAFSGHPATPAKALQRQIFAELAKIALTILQLLLVFVMYKTVAALPLLVVFIVSLLGYRIAILWLARPRRT